MVQWQFPTDFVAGSIRRPQPIRLGGGSVVDYGYEGQALLMAPIQGPLSRNATPLPNLSADVKYIVCRDVCIPGKAHLTLSSPAGGDWASWHALFEQTRAQLPKPAPTSWKVTAVSAKQYFMLSVQERTQLLFLSNHHYHLSTIGELDRIVGENMALLVLAICRN
jgi:DsbC/DsbD-like thiol-disulfide interchange protein